MANYTYENLIDPFALVRGAAANTFTTAKDVSPVGLAQLAANELKVGSKLELEAWGEFSTTTTPTLQLMFLLGVAAGGLASSGVTLAASGVITTGLNAAAWPWHMKWAGVVTAVGTSGSIYGQGILELGTSLTALAQSAMPVTAAARAVTIDTTVPKTLGVGAAWGTSNVANSLIVDVFNPQVLNQGKSG